MLFAVAAAAAAADMADMAALQPDMIAVAVASLVGSFGAAGSAVAITYYFLGFLRDEGRKRDRIFSEFRDYHAESQKKFQDQIGRLADRTESFQRAVADQLARMSETEGVLLRDCILATREGGKRHGQAVDDLRRGLAEQRSSFRAELQSQATAARSTQADCLAVLKALADRLEK